MLPDELLRALDLFPDAAVVTAADGTVVAANRGLHALLGAAPGAVRGRPLADLTADPPGAVAEFLRTCARTGDRVPGGLTLPPVGGDPVACRCEGAVLRPRAADAEPLLLLRFVPREQALAAEAQLRFLTNAVPALLSYIDREYRYRLVNRAYEVWFGHPREEVLGRHMRDVLGEAAWAVIRPHAEAAMTGRPVSFETFAPYKDGGGRWVAVAYTPDVAPGGEVRGYVALVNDITPLKRVEEALREADRRKDEFLATLAHELRNPLAPLLTGLRLLTAAGLDPADRVRAVGIMDRQVRHLARVTDDLLDVSRITRGVLRLRAERLDLTRLVALAAADYCGDCDAAGVPVVVDLPAHPVWVTGDPTRLTQVVANLVQNACKFTGPGGRVAVRLAADLPGPAAELRVSDTGVGMAPELLPRLFEPFSQGDRTLDRANGGLGLGLALVKGFTELHGGRVEANSDGPGRGAEFVVRLPLDPEPAAPAPAATPTGGRPRRVLVIEDNRDAADSLRVLLEVFGHAVRVAYTGPDGVREAAGWGPEVVLSDIGLPGLDGFGVARSLRADAATADVLLVAVTGYGDDETKHQARAAGFDHVLTKPADPAALLGLLS